jgi:outer membrane immunogenic protein
MMRDKLIFNLVGAVFGFAVSGIAFAADMAVKAPPPPPAPPPISWTGWYGGINVGGTWGGDSISLNTTNLQIICDIISPCGPGLSSAIAAASAQGTTGVFSGNNHGFIGGGQLGYNWQFANWVAGFEADIQGVGDKITDGSNTTFGVVGFPAAATAVATNLSVTKELDYFGTVRGRLGWLAYPSLLVYGTGGLAYGGVKSSMTANQNLLAIIPDNWSANGGISQTRTGWTAGGGFEWMFAPHWSAKVEYLYYDLGSVTYNTLLVAGCSLIAGCPPGVPLFVNNVQTSTRFNGNIVRAGVNWHF